MNYENRPQENKTEVNKPKILLVDDTQANIYAMKNILGSLDVMVVTASSGNEALELLIQHDFAVVLLDVQLPDISGLEVAELMTMYEDTRYTPVIFITAMAQDPQLILKGYELGAVDYIIKPFDPHILKSKVQFFLKSYSRKAQTASPSTAPQAPIPVATGAKNHSKYKLWSLISVLSIALLTGLFYSASLSKKNAQLLSYSKELERHNTHSKRINEAYKKFIPYETLSLLNKESILDVHPGDQVQKRMVVLFVDIRDTNQNSADKTMSKTNQLLKMVQEPIVEHHGIINRYLGDGVMALFYTSADDALAASMAMLRTFQKFPQIEVGIALDEGEMIVGTVGSEKHMEQRVLSPAVNVAKKIASLTRLCKASLLISENILNKLKDPSKYTTRLLEPIKVKGLKNAVNVYQVVEGELFCETMQDFSEAIALYRQKKYIDAGRAFEKVLSTNEADTTAKAYLNHCQNSLSARR